MNKFLSVLISLLLLLPISLGAQRSKIAESVERIKTYPFYDPDPVANPSKLFYPYFRFDGFASKGIDKDWKVVTLENGYIRIKIYPEIGGKIWSAVDKTTNKEFIYDNHVVKFRDIAMRGPWTSGGIEFNFGIIGHVPTSSTPIDYLIKEKKDGSASCYVASYELLTHTFWMVEINLPSDKAYFTTKTTWYNASSINQPYYQWMNAGYPADENAEFCYPGTNYIGHGGELHSFPLDEEGRDISWYEKNNFGNSKSYHIIGKYNDFYGIYWHDNDYGSVHYANYDDKLGMKIFLWGLSREGAIWEDLLTDSDGQYIELQSGRMYNQPASGSSYTPFKHAVFEPQAADQWIEYWYPVKGIKGILKASDIGALNVLRDEDYLKLNFSPTQKLVTLVKVYNGEKEVCVKQLECDVLETWQDSIPIEQLSIGNLRVVIGDNLLVYSEKKSDNVISRPKKIPNDFNWNSVYGLYTQGRQWMNQKVYDKAEKFLCLSLKQDPYFIPSLNSLASLYYRQGRYQEALAYCRTSLSINTYYGETNYLYGLCNMALGKNTDAKDGFSVAAYSPSIRSAAYEKLAEMFLIEHNWGKVEHYARKSLQSNPDNFNAQMVLVVTYRKMNQNSKAATMVSTLLEELPLYHMARFEAYLLNLISQEEFMSLIRSELPQETLMELSEWYENIGCNREALMLLSFIPDYPIANYKRAYILHKEGNSAESLVALEKANKQSPELVFPFRPTTLEALSWAKTVSSDWKIKYYEGLIWWANQNEEKALSLFNKCGDPDFVPFYLSRALLKSEEEKLKDLLLAEKMSESWRIGFALLDYYNSIHHWTEAVKVGKKYANKYPSNYYIGLKYAKALCEAGCYKQCISTLGNLLVLPNEGAYEGRTIYRTANLYLAIEELKQERYKRALANIKLSKEWPENLGVGKPYDNMIDNRFENFVEAEVYKRMGDDGKARELLLSVAQDKSKHSRFESASLLNAFALRNLGNKNEADELVKKWLVEYPDNQVAQWCAAIYNGEYDKANQMLTLRDEQVDTTPWETSFRDDNFNLIVRLFSTQ